MNSSEKKSADGCDENQGLCNYNKLSKKHFRVFYKLGS